MKKPLDISMVANNARYVQVTALNPDGSPVDITGFTIKWQAFKKGTPAALITKSTTDAKITITEGAAGKFTFWLNAADTKELDAGEYIHEAVTVDGAGKPVTLTNNDPQLTAGRLTIREQYTAQD